MHAQCKMSFTISCVDFNLHLFPYKTSHFPIATSHHLPHAMASSISLFILNFLLLSGFSLALRGSSWQQGQCQINSVNAQEPSHQIQSEGGVTDFWDFNKDEFQCAGVSIHRHRIQPRSMILPSYHNSPVLVYIMQGQGLHGIMISGCPETYESSQESLRGQGQGQRFRDRHQKIGAFKKGDIIAVPAGAAHWCYNNGDEEVIAVVLQDNANSANQLDQNPRSFYLAGNPESRQEQQRYGGEHGFMRGQHEFGNVFRGFGVEILAEAFGVDQETARKLQSEDDSRGHIIRVDRGLQVIKPPYGGGEEYGRQEEGRGGPYNANGIEETICTSKVRENLDNPSRADVYNPHAGRYTTVNSLTLPILDFLQLSAARGVLYRNGLMSPHWYVNAHNIIYVTRGEARMQVVNQRGQAVFDGQVKEGQVLVVPQNYALVKKAGEQGCEWVSFNTNANAMINTLSGRTSAFRGLPVDVIANSYQISREEAEKLKFSRRDTLLFSARGGRFASS